jgi:hypothetical protein
LAAGRRQKFKTVLILTFAGRQSMVIELCLTIHPVRSAGILAGSPKSVKFSDLGFSAWLPISPTMNEKA